MVKFISKHTKQDTAPLLPDSTGTPPGKKSSYKSKKSQSDSASSRPRKKQQDAPKKRPEKKTRETPPPQKETVQKKEEKHGTWSREQYKVPEEEGKVRFHDLPLCDEIMHAIADLEYKYCTPVQQEFLPDALQGLDVGGKAQTGTGKTAAFLLATYSRLMQSKQTELRNGTPRALILAPTRELAIQIEKEAAMIGKYTPFKSIAVYGGQKLDIQQKQLNDHVDVIIATPGRLIDFKRRHVIHLGHVEMLVIDEADRMLDMGFIPDVREIVRSTPPRHDRQTMLLSATLTPDVLRLAGQWMHKEAKTVEIEPEQVAVSSVDQQTYIVRDEEKIPLLVNLFQKEKPERVLIFTNRRDTAEKVQNALRDYEISCGVFTGALPQSKRESRLQQFRESKITALVATDVAGRGLHIEGVSHVINFNLPTDPEDYVHRIGRTGRAGSTGISISFASEDDAHYIPEIEKYLGDDLSCTYPPEEWLKPLPPAKKRPGSSRSRNSGQPQKRRRRRSRPRRPS